MCNAGTTLQYDFHTSAQSFTSTAQISQLPIHSHHLPSFSPTTPPPPPRIIHTSRRLVENRSRRFPHFLFRSTFSFDLTTFFLSCPPISFMNSLSLFPSLPLPAVKDLSKHPKRDCILYKCSRVCKLSAKSQLRRLLEDKLFVTRSFYILCMRPFTVLGLMQMSSVRSH